MRWIAVLWTLCFLALGTPAFASVSGTPSSVLYTPLVVEAPLVSEDELPDDTPIPGERDPVTRQDNMNKAIIIAIIIAEFALVASFGALICCCCLYMGYYY
ncbi:MAG TPA: hypothetical protein QGF58_18940 [Myxococcota bacterium]|nr:hypothetical protein [Myxococcota bacterium]